MPFESQGGFALFGALLLLGGVFGLVPILLPYLIMTHTVGKKTRETYECGMDTIGSAWIRFSIVFYLYALIFLAFEVDVLYVIPVALVYGAEQYVWRDLVEIVFFFLILALAVVFAWRKGVFRAMNREIRSSLARNR
jgi:NADH-quinone oxidoreductase subunit A